MYAVCYYHFLPVQRAQNSANFVLHFNIVTWGFQSEDSCWDHDYHHYGYSVDAIHSQQEHNNKEGSTTIIGQGAHDDKEATARMHATIGR